VILKTLLTQDVLALKALTWEVSSSWILLLVKMVKFGVSITTEMLFTEEVSTDGTCKDQAG
jgi:hypothetical protein